MARAADVGHGALEGAIEDHLAKRREVRHADETGERAARSRGGRPSEELVDAGAGGVEQQQRARRGGRRVLGRRRVSGASWLRAADGAPPA